MDQFDSERTALAWWQAEDVLNRSPDWPGPPITRENAEGILMDIEDRLRDRMIEAGWDVIDEGIMEWLEANGYNHTDTCSSQRTGEWSGHRNPDALDDPDGPWVCDECGGIIYSHTPTKIGGYT